MRNFLFESITSPNNFKSEKSKEEKLIYPNILKSYYKNLEKVKLNNQKMKKNKRELKNSYDTYFNNPAINQKSLDKSLKKYTNNSLAFKKFLEETSMPRRKKYKVNTVYKPELLYEVNKETIHNLLDSNPIFKPKKESNIFLRTFNNKKFTEQQKNFQILFEEEKEQRDYIKNKINAKKKINDKTNTEISSYKKSKKLKYIFNKRMLKELSIQDNMELLKDIPKMPPPQKIDEPKLSKIKKYIDEKNDICDLNFFEDDKLKKIIKKSLLKDINKDLIHVDLFKNFMKEENIINFMSDVYSLPHITNSLIMTKPYPDKNELNNILSKREHLHANVNKALNNIVIQKILLKQKEEAIKEEIALKNALINKNENIIEKIYDSLTKEDDYEKSFNDVPFGLNDFFNKISNYKDLGIANSKLKNAFYNHFLTNN